MKKRSPSIFMAAPSEFISLTVNAVFSFLFASSQMPLIWFGRCVFSHFWLQFSWNCWRLFYQNQVMPRAIKRKQTKNIIIFYDADIVFPRKVCLFYRLTSGILVIKQRQFRSIYQSQPSKLRSRSKVWFLFATYQCRKKRDGQMFSKC